MSSTPTATPVNADQSEDEEKDHTPVIPLRQRKLPASFWQEPCVPSKTNNNNTSPPAHQSSNQPFTASSLHPWPVAISTSVVPAFFPQRLPNGFTILSHPQPLWVRSPLACCSCPTCLNYSCRAPRLTNTFGGLRYRPILNVPCCPGLNCVDQNCKLCTPSESWQPERIRQSRLRSSRYNALIDG